MNRILPITVSLAIGLMTGGCRNQPALPFIQLTEARHLTADLRTQLAQASDASDRAVMAGSDQESVAFAHEAEQAAAAIESKAARLSELLQHLSYSRELQALRDFTDRFGTYRELDHEVLALAVQNTNLKALRLSFGPVRETADDLQGDLQAAARLAPANDRCRVNGLVAQVELAVREIQVLQAPHIAEQDEAAMTKLEKQMAERRVTAREALATLGGNATAAMARPLGAASAALARFDEVSAELVTLSRRNSNVHSLALALRRAPQMVAACDASLALLQGALANEGFGGTR